MAVGKAIRLAPMGPVIGNAEGGLATPGQGLQLRMAEMKATSGGQIDFTPSELGGGTLRVALNGVKPNLRYKAQVQINTFYETNRSGAVVRLRVTVERSLNGGASWVAVGSDTFESHGSNEARMAVANVPMQLGGDANWAIPESAAANDFTQMTIRAMVQTTENSDSCQLPNQQAFISLSELL